MVLEKEMCAMEKMYWDYQCGYGLRENHSENYECISGSSFKHVHVTYSLSLRHGVGRDIEDDRCQCVCGATGQTVRLQAYRI